VPATVNPSADLVGKKSIQYTDSAPALVGWIDGSPAVAILDLDRGSLGELTSKLVHERIETCGYLVGVCDPPSVIRAS
jgi:hypothetical protein